MQGLKVFKSQSLATQAKKGEQLVSLKPAIKEAFNLMGDDIVELSVENESLKNQIGQYDGKWLEESKTKMLKQIDDEKRAKLIGYKTSTSSAQKTIITIHYHLPSSHIEEDKSFSQYVGVFCRWLPSVP